MLRSNGTKTLLYEPWNSDLSGDEWVYFSDPGTRRSLFIAHHDDDALLESYYNYNDSMTVFGFGRSNDPLEPLMSTVPNQFTFGFINDTSFTRCRDSITSAYKLLSVTLGSPEEPGPAVPVLLLPNDGGSGAAIPVQFRWRAAERATSYRLQVSTSSGFAGGMVFDDSTLTDTTASISPLSGKTLYYWRVSARNSSGSSAYSSPWSFQTGLNVPVLLTPAHGATGRQQPLQLIWSSVSGALAYHVQVSTESGFTSGLILDDAAVVDTQRTISGLAGSTLYYWRTAARDAGRRRPLRPARTFTTAVPSPG